MIGKELGSYRIIAPIGEGSLGLVYLAEHVNLGNRVALRKLADAVAEDADLRRAVITASRTAAKCRHPNLVTVFDLVDLPEHLAVAMELLEGDSLAVHLERMAEPAAPVETWRLLEPVLDAVAHAHSEGIVHGALRPGNLVLARLGGRIVCKATDLGLPCTLASGTIGAPDADDEPPAWLNYAAPEQHASPDALTPAADIFALGVIFFEALAGTRPFHEASTDALVQAIRTRRAPGIRSVKPGLSHAVEDAIGRALELNPAARWPDLPAFATALRAALAPAVTSPATAPVPTAARPMHATPLAAPVTVAPVVAAPVAAVPIVAPTVPEAAPTIAEPVPISKPAPEAAQPPAQATPIAAPSAAPPPAQAQAPAPAATPPQPTHYGERAPRRLAPRPHLGRRARSTPLKDDPVLAALEPRSTSRDKWIIVGTVGLCLTALLIAMVVALTSGDRTSASGDLGNANNANHNATVATPNTMTPGMDAGPVATNVTCATLRGNWRGTFYAGRNRTRHDFNGAVHGNQTACRATFRITTSQRGYVMQYFTVTISRGAITFRGTRVDRSMSPHGYSKDTFVGHLDLSKQKFSGRVRDTKGIIGTVQMKKQ